MIIAALFALALASADEPVATAPAQPTATADSATKPARDPEIPASAPADDYGFVAWCHGALTGHMELHDAVAPELNKVSPSSGSDDAAMTAAGKDYLALYSEALKSAEAASTAPLHERGAAADAAGYRIWAAARAAAPRTQMWSYLMWEPPPRCETAAKRLEARSTLLGAALRPGVTPTPDRAAEAAAALEPAADSAPAPVDPGPGAPLAAVSTDGLRGPR